MLPRAGPRDALQLGDSPRSVRATRSDQPRNIHSHTRPFALKHPIDRVVDSRRLCEAGGKATAHLLPAILASLNMTGGASGAASPSNQQHRIERISPSQASSPTRYSSSLTPQPMRSSPPSPTYGALYHQRPAPNRDSALARPRSAPVGSKPGLSRGGDRIIQRRGAPPQPKLTREVSSVLMQRSMHQTASPATLMRGPQRLRAFGASAGFK